MKLSIPSKNLFIADSSNLADFFFQYQKGYDHCTFELPKQVLNHLLEKYDYDHEQVDSYLLKNGNLPSVVEYIKNNPSEFLEWHSDSYALFIPFDTDELDITSFENGISINNFKTPTTDNNFSFFEMIGLLSVDGTHLTLMDSQTLSKDTISLIRNNRPSSSIKKINDLGFEENYFGPFHLLDEKVIFDWKYDGLAKFYKLYNQNKELVECVLLYCEYHDGHYNLTTNIELEKYLLSKN